MQLESYNRSLFRQTLWSVLRVVAVLIGISWVVPGGVTAQQEKGLYHGLFSVSFPTEQEGWVCGRWGTVLHTKDGGSTWISQNTGTRFTLSSIYFVDHHNGWAVGDGGTIIHTQDGGRSWVKQQSPVPYFLMGVYFATPLKGWIVTEWTHILYTVDGGKAWRIQFSDEDYILKAISFCDPLHGWAVGEYGYIYHTGDGGISWQKQGGFCTEDEATGKLVGGNFLFDVVAVNPQTAWAVGIDGYVTKTVDGGETWQEVITGAPRAQLYCVNSDRKSTVMIGGKGVFLSSTDRGQTWHSPVFEPPITYGWIYGLARRGSSGFVAVGWEGAIYLGDSSSWYRVSY